MPMDEVSPLSNPEVIIVGAGLSGLACAVHLKKAGVPFVILEAAEAAGGRVRTDVIDGFRLDRGFQVLLTAYPEAKRILDYEALELKPLFAGADVFRGGHFHRVADPTRHLWQALYNYSNEVGNFHDKWFILLLRKQLETLHSVPRDTDEATTEHLLQSYGFSKEMIDRFFRAFFGGIFLERELRTSARMFQFILAMMNEGLSAIPRLGMQAIPDQLAAKLPPGSIRFKTTISSVSPNRIVLAKGDTLAAPHIVLAVDEKSAGLLLHGEKEKAPLQRAVTCMYFATDDRSLTRDPIVFLDGEGRGPVNNAAILSNISSDYAPAGQRLISLSVLGAPGSDALETTVRDQMTGWFGPSVNKWRHLRTSTITNAHPESRQMHPGDEPGETVIAPGLYRCGDYVQDVSINGALISGRRAAEAILAARK
ncbi:NAD(P)/FAD-dependent oxidoreductase [soil metagenome]